jgi:hypothetical protein
MDRLDACPKLGRVNSLSQVPALGRSRDATGQLNYAGELETVIRLVAGFDDEPLEGDLLADLVHIWSLVHGFSHLLLAGQLDHTVASERAITDLLEGVVRRISISTRSGTRGLSKKE